MDNNQKSSADHIIEHLLAIDVDGETMQYIISGTMMGGQMLKQLMRNASELEIKNNLQHRIECQFGFETCTNKGFMCEQCDEGSNYECWDFMYTNK
jgi:transcription initiation factor IIE alpha subunit